MDLIIQEMKANRSGLLLLGFSCATMAVVFVVLLSRFNCPETWLRRAKARADDGLRIVRAWWGRPCPLAHW